MRLGGRHALGKQVGLVRDLPRPLIEGAAGPAYSPPTFSSAAAPTNSAAQESSRKVPAICGKLRRWRQPAAPPIISLQAKRTNRGVHLMKTIISTLIALSVLAAVAAPANAAWDTKAFWAELDRGRN